MEKKNFALILGIVAVSVVLLYWSVSAQLNSEKATKKPPEKLSAVQDTDESWRQHMGHHPDQYKDCL
jgi:hypothetical protein